MGAVLDTHTALWYVLRSRRLSKAAAQAIRSALSRGRRIYISAISIVETTYLVERGRIPSEALQKLEAGIADAESGLEVVPLDAALAQSVMKVPRDLVPDMPDRIIAATALHLSLPLITRDARIQSSGITTIW